MTVSVSVRAGWRQLDPETGDEAGTTEGHFDVHWEGDYFYGTNLAVATSNNVYLDGLGAHPDVASHETQSPSENAIYLWMCVADTSMINRHAHAPFSIPVLACYPADSARIASVT